MLVVDNNFLNTQHGLDNDLLDREESLSDFILAESSTI